MGRISKRRGRTNEIAIARILGATRNFYKAEDLRHPILSIECKHRTKIHKYFHDWVAQARAAAAVDKTPIVVVHEHGTFHKDDLVIVNLKDFAEFIDWVMDMVKDDLIDGWIVKEND